MGNLSSPSQRWTEQGRAANQNGYACGGAGVLGLSGSHSNGFRRLCVAKCMAWTRGALASWIPSPAQMPDWHEEPKD